MIVNTVFGEEEIESKACIHCGIIQPLSEYPTHKGHKDGHDGRCKTCIREKAKLVKILKNDPNTPPQPEVCDSCGESPRRGEFHLDHDHNTGKFRGWLDGNCNKAIGQLGDNIEGITNPLRYLINFHKRNGDVAELVKAKKLLGELIEIING